MNQRTNQVKQKIGRARRHLRELHDTIQAFFDDHPFTWSHETDLDTGDLIFKMKRCAPIPRQIPLVIGDVLQNLRSSLDHLVWHLVEANGKRPTDNNAFPFSKSAQSYQQTARMRLKGIPDAAVKLIEQSKPYPGGDEDLYSLHSLNNHDKHRMILVVGAAHVVSEVESRGKIVELVFACLSHLLTRSVMKTG
jgi:hypothetical protein